MSSAKKAGLLSVIVCIALILCVGCTPESSVSQVVATASSTVPPATQPATEGTQPTTSLPPTATPTDVPTYTPTAVATATFLPTGTATPPPSPTITPTPAPAYNQPGYYSAGGCATITYVRKATIEFCVVSVEVTPDYSMIFSVSWTMVYLRPGLTATKRPDIENPNMYIVDNLGKHYNHISVSGSAAENTSMTEGSTVYGWFVFPPAAVGATSFTFHDDDNKLAISDIVLTNPVQVYADLLLQSNPYVLRYRLENWQASILENGEEVLTHVDMPTCQIAEQPPSSEIQGNYINTMEFGKMVYDIYRFYEPDVTWSTREYVLVSGPDQAAPASPLVFRVTIPYDSAEACLYSVADTLSNLLPQP